MGERGGTLLPSPMLTRCRKLRWVATSEKPAAGTAQFGTQFVVKMFIVFFGNGLAVCIQSCESRDWVCREVPFQHGSLRNRTPLPHKRRLSRRGPCVFHRVNVGERIGRCRFPADIALVTVKRGSRDAAVNSVQECERKNDNWFTMFRPVSSGFKNEMNGAIYKQRPLLFLSFLYEYSLAIYAGFAAQFRLHFAQATAF